MLNCKLLHFGIFHKLFTVDESIVLYFGRHSAKIFIRGKSIRFVFRSIFVPILTYGHECWVMTERVRFRVQAPEMGFLRKFKGLSLLDKVKSTEIC